MNAVFTNFSVMLFFNDSVYICISDHRVFVRDCSSIKVVFTRHAINIVRATFLLFNIIFIWVRPCFMLSRRYNRRWYWMIFINFILRLNWITDCAGDLTLIETFFRLLIFAKEMCNAFEDSSFLFFVVVLLFQLFTFLCKFILGSNLV